jgi:hypothetical protein
VGKLLLGVLQQLLAHELGHEEGFGDVRDGVGWEESRTARHQCDEMLDQLGDPLAGEGRHGEVLGALDLEVARRRRQVLEDFLPPGAVDLVDSDNRARRYTIGDVPVARPDCRVCLDHQHANVDIGHRVRRRLVQPGPESRLRFVNAGGVDEHDLAVGPV